MLDAPLRRYIDPPLSKVGRQLAVRGIRANWITLLGFVAAVAAMIAIAREYYLVGLVLILFNRLCDGLDGAIARATQPTDFGAFLDAVLDLVSYSAIPFGFALADPGRALAAAFLMFGFVASGVTFLAFSMFAERRGVAPGIRELKSIYTQGGLIEGTETFLAMAAACLFPDEFSVIAYLFGILSFMTAGARIASAVETLQAP